MKYSLLTLIFLLPSIISSNIFISSSSSCFHNCLGDLTEPFNGLLSALVEKNNSEFIILNSGGLNFIRDSQVLPDGQIFNYQTSIQVSGETKIRPLYCSDPEAISLQYQNCTTGQITLYLKSDRINISVIDSLILENIVVDGSENIAIFNEPGETLNYCLLRDVLCCGVSPNPDVNCGKNLEIWPYNLEKAGLFELNSQNSTSKFVLENCSFLNMNFFSTSAFIYVTDFAMVSMKRVNFTNTYFPFGLIYYDSFGSSTRFATLDRIILFNYNPYQFNDNIDKEKGIILTANHIDSNLANTYFISNSFFYDIPYLNNKTNAILSRGNITILNTSFIHCISQAAFIINREYGILTASNVFFSDIMISENSVLVADNGTTAKYTNICFEKLRILSNKYLSSVIKIVSNGSITNLSIYESHFISSFEKITVVFISPDGNINDFDGFKFIDNSITNKFYLIEFPTKLSTLKNTLIESNSHILTQKIPMDFMFVNAQYLIIDNLDFRNNVLLRCPFLSSNTWFAIDFSYNLTNVVMSNNSFRSYPYVQGNPNIIYLYRFDSLTLNNITFENNIIIGCMNLFLLMTGNTLNNEGLILRNNTFEDSTDNGDCKFMYLQTLSIWTSKDFIIANNTIVGSFVLIYEEMITELAFSGFELSNNLINSPNMFYIAYSRKILMKNFRILDNYMFGSLRIFYFSYVLGYTLDSVQVKGNYLLENVKIFSQTEGSSDLFNMVFEKNYLMNHATQNILMHFESCNNNFNNIEYNENILFYDSYLFFDIQGRYLLTNATVKNNTFYGSMFTARGFENQNGELTFENSVFDSNRLFDKVFLVGITTVIGEIFLNSVHFLNNYAISTFEGISFIYITNAKITFNISLENNVCIGTYGTCKFLYIFQSAIHLNNILMIRNNTVRGPKSRMLSFELLSSIQFYDLYIFRNNLHDGASVFDFNTISSLKFYNLNFTENIFGNQYEKIPVQFFSVTSKTQMDILFDGAFISKNTLFTNAYIFRISTQNTIIFQSKFTENQISDGSYLISLEKSSNLVLNDVICNDNLLEGGSSLLRNKGGYMNISNAVFKTNLMKGSSYLLFFTFKSLVYLNNISIASNSKLISETNNIANYNMIQGVNSEISFSNLTSDDTSEFLLSISSKISGDSLLFNRTLGLGYKIIQDFNSIISLSNIQILGNPSLVLPSLSLFQSDSGNYSIFNLYISDHNYNIGNLFNFINSDLSIRSSKISNINFQEGSLFNLLQSNSFEIIESSFSSISVFLIADTVLNVNLYNINLDFDKPRSTLLKILNSDSVLLSKLTFTFSSDFSKRIGSVIMIEEVKHDIFIDNTTILNSFTDYGALFIALKATSPNVKITNSIFTQNIGVGTYAGAISVIDALDCIFNISNSTFIKNKAFQVENQGGRGGALYLGSNIYGIGPKFSLSNNKFISNSAELNGGAIYVNGILPLIDDSNYFENNTISGSEIKNLASQGYLIRPKVKSASRILESGVMNFEGVGSGHPFNGLDAFELIDGYSNVVTDDSSSILIITSHKSSFGSSVESVKAIKGVYDLAEISFTDSPGSTTALTFISTGVKSFSFLQEIQQLNFSILVSFRNCHSGEVVQSSGACQPCPEGFATFDFSLNSKSACIKCDSSSMACLGGDQVGAKSGYFQYNHTANLILPCKMKSACLGNFFNNTFYPRIICNHGYHGNLCDQCNDGFVKESEKCKLCSESYTQYIILVGCIIFNFFLLSKSIKAANEDLEIQQDQQTLGFNQNLMKNIVNYLQVTSLIGGINIRWPDFLSQTNNVGQYIAVTTTTLFNLQCFYPKDSLRLSIMNLIITSFAPIMMFLVCVAIILVNFIIKKRKIKGNSQLKNMILISFIVIGFNYQTPVLRANIEMFQCTNLYRDDSPLYFLTSDYDLQCWEGEHAIWAYSFSFPLLILWGIILPVSVLYKIRQNKNQLNEKEILVNYYYVYRGLKSDKYYWEFVTIIRKYLLILIIIFGRSSNSGLQIFLVLYVMLVSYTIEIKNQPYINEKINKLNILNLRACTVLTIACIYFYVDTKYETPTLIILVITTLILFHYYLTWVKNFLVFRYSDLKQKISKSEKWSKNKKLSRIFNFPADQKKVSRNFESFISLKILDNNELESPDNYKLNPEKQYIKSPEIFPENSEAETQFMKLNLSPEKYEGEFQFAKLALNPSEKLEKENNFKLPLDSTKWEKEGETQSNKLHLNSPKNNELLPDESNSLTKLDVKFKRTNFLFSKFNVDEEKLIEDRSPDMSVYHIDNSEIKKLNE